MEMGVHIVIESILDLEELKSSVKVMVTLCLKRHEVSEKIGLGSLAHFMVDMKQGKLKCKKNFKIHVHLTKLLTI